MAAGCAIMPLVLLGLLLSGARWWFLAPAIVVAVLAVPALLLPSSPREVAVRVGETVAGTS